MQLLVPIHGRSFLTLHFVKDASRGVPVRGVGAHGVDTTTRIGGIYGKKNGRPLATILSNLTLCFHLPHLLF
jgi:hypothetical protein